MPKTKGDALRLKSPRQSSDKIFDAAIDSMRTDVQVVIDAMRNDLASQKQLLLGLSKRSSELERDVADIRQVVAEMSVAPSPAPAREHLVSSPVVTMQRYQADIEILKGSIETLLQITDLVWMPEGLNALGEKAEMHKCLRQRMPSVPPLPGELFDVFVDRTDFGRLGIKVEPSNGDELIIRSLHNGLVQAWNQRHPAMSVLPLDEIVAVDGESDDLTNRMQKEKVLRFTVRRAVMPSVPPRPGDFFDVVVDRSNYRMLGIKVESVDKGQALMVRSLEKGLVQVWNKIHPDFSVLPLDVIVAVDGERGDAGKLLQMTNEAKVLRLTVCRGEDMTLV